MAHEIGNGVALARARWPLHYDTTTSIDGFDYAALLTIRRQWKVDLMHVQIGLPSRPIRSRPRPSVILVVFVVNQATPAWGNIMVIVAHPLDQRIVDADHANVGTLTENKRRGEADNGPTFAVGTGLQVR